MGGVSFIHMFQIPGIPLFISSTKIFPALDRANTLPRYIFREITKNEPKQGAPNAFGQVELEQRRRP